MNNIYNTLDEESSINKKYLNFENKLVYNEPNINLTSLEKKKKKKNKNILIIYLFNIKENNNYEFFFNYNSGFKLFK